FVLGFLYLARARAAGWLRKLGLNASTAAVLAKTAPIFGVLISIAWVFLADMGGQGVALTGDIPAGLPAIDLSLPDWELLTQLAMPAFLISLIGDVESVSVGKTLASKRREKIDPDQELLGLGAANLASAVSGGFPVTGGFSRSVVNFD